MNALTIFVLCGLVTVLAFIVWAVNSTHRGVGVTIYGAELHAAAAELAEVRAEVAAERIVRLELAADAEVVP